MEGGGVLRVEGCKEGCRGVQRGCRGGAEGVQRGCKGQVRSQLARSHHAQAPCSFGSPAAVSPGLATATAPCAASRRGAGAADLGFEVGGSTCTRRRRRGESGGAWPYSGKVAAAAASSCVRGPSTGNARLTPPARPGRAGGERARPRRGGEPDLLPSPRPKPPCPRGAAPPMENCSTWYCARTAAAAAAVLLLRGP